MLKKLEKTENVQNLWKKKNLEDFERNVKKIKILENIEYQTILK